jgi:hypothetical protein
MGDNPYKYCNLQWEIIHTLLSCDNIFFVHVYICVFSLVLFCCVCCNDDCSMFGLEINKIIIIIIIIYIYKYTQCIYIYKRLKKLPTYEPTGCRIGNKC